MLEELVKLKYTNNDKLENKHIKIENDYISYKHIIYKQKKEVLVYTKRKGKIQKKIRIYMLEDLPEYDLKKMKTSITANVVHSLDAECLCRVLEYTYILHDNKTP